MPSFSSALSGSCARPASYVASALSYSFMKNCRWPLRLRRKPPHVSLQLKSTLRLIIRTRAVVGA